MKLTSILLFCGLHTLMFSSLKPIDDSIPLFDSTFIYFGNNDTLLDRADKHDYYDSAQFKIIRFYFVSGKTSDEILRDTVTGISDEKYYRSDGRLYMQGRKHDLNYHIGIWKYYYPNGRIKEINFDSTVQISYYRATKIAGSQGYHKGRHEITEEIFEQTYYWKVIDWTEEDSMGSKGKYILIRRSNGEVIIPKNNELEYKI